MKIQSSFSIMCIHSYIIDIKKQGWVWMLCTLLPACLWGQGKLSGSVTNASGAPLAFASIITDDFTLGTVTDEKGNFIWELPEGEWRVIVRYIGYKEQKDTLIIKGNVQKNFVLEEEELSTEDVYITSDGRDPAYGIIEKAIANKEKNGNPYPQYAHKAYTKTSIFLPKNFNFEELEGLKLGGKKKGEDNSMLDLPPELRSKILYLSETLSEVSIQAPEKAKEKIISSRVSGDREGYSMFGNMINQFDPYKNRIILESDKGLISPVSDNAFFYYDFKLLGTAIEKGQKSYKIQLIPKRLYDPVLRGIIYIADSSYAIKELEVFAAKRQQLETMDSLHLRKQYTQIGDAWLPYNSRMAFTIVFNLGLVKIPFDGFSSSLLSEYNVKPSFSPKTFNAEVIAVSDSALHLHKMQWDRLRPMPLTPEEAFDFHLKDSLEQVRKSPRYLDSLQSRNNKIKPLWMIINGQKFSYHRIKLNIQINPLLEWAGFTPMEGFYLMPKADIQKAFTKNRKLYVTPMLRYGFTNQKLSYQVTGKWESNPKKGEVWSFGGGDFVHQLSDMEQIDMYLNSLNAVFYKLSFIRLYQQRYGELRYQRELFNGFTATAGMGYYQRTAMQNKTEFSWSKSGEPYHANEVLNNSFYTTPMPSHQTLMAEVELRYRPGTKYISVPNGKIDLGSKYPTFAVHYQRAISINTQSSNFSRVRLSISDETSLGLMGVLHWRVTAGRYLHIQRIYFPDMFHYKGNERFFHFGNFDVFYLMPYYRFSGTLPYIEAHAEQAFNGFLLNKIPLIRRLQLNEYVGVHGLFQQGQTPYVELNAGVEKKIFKIIPLRIDFNVRLMGNAGQKYGYKLITQNVLDIGQ